MQFDRNTIETSKNLEKPNATNMDNATIKKLEEIDRKIFVQSFLWSSISQKRCHALIKKDSYKVGQCKSGRCNDSIYCSKHNEGGDHVNLIGTLSFKPEYVSEPEVYGIIAVIYLYRHKILSAKRKTKKFDLKSELIEFLFHPFSMYYWTRMKPLYFLIGCVNVELKLGVELPPLDQLKKCPCSKLFDCSSNKDQEYCEKCLTYEDCSICMVKRKHVIPMKCCNNRMCDHCWKTWERKRSCPFCRQPMLKLLEHLLNHAVFVEETPKPKPEIEIIDLTI